MKKSVSLGISLKFMVVVAVSILVLSFSIIALIYFFVRQEQGRELREASDSIEKILEQKNDFARLGFEDDDSRLPMDFSFLPYYISYLVSPFDSGLSKVDFTSDPFLPILPITNSRAKKFLAKDYFIDGNLEILYLSKKSADGKYLIQTSLDIERDISSQILDKLSLAISIAALPILLVSFFMSLLITKNTMAPVVRLTKSAEKISSSNLGTLLPRTKNGDEIDSLAATFNLLFERLKTDFDREKNFTSDVSHELKTPVAVILGQTNLLLRWGKDNPAQLQKSLEAIKSEAKSMEAVITNLLQISRLENGKIKPSVSDVDIKKMFLHLVEEFFALAPGVDFVLPEKESVIVKTDWELLHQTLTVVISNSVKFCGEKCSINFDWQICDGYVRLLIQDDGEGFSDKVLPHVFKRFYRGDEAHVRSVGGSGLGLSIAQTIVESLGGKISARNGSPCGAVIEIDLVN